MQYTNGTKMELVPLLDKHVKRI